jgi:hypothetical protein
MRVYMYTSEGSDRRSAGVQALVLGKPPPPLRSKRGADAGARSYGTAKSGVGISAMSVLRPDLMMKCVVPVIMAGIIAVRRPPLFILSSPDDARPDLRPRRICSHCRQPYVAMSNLRVRRLTYRSDRDHAAVQRLRPAWCGSLGRPRRSRGWLRHWHSR